MVPGKGKYGIVSKGKGAHSKSGSATKSKEIKRERISDTEDSDEETVTLPDLRLLDYVKCLPRFTAITGRPDDNGVLMEDLDVLQMEMESLLNSVVMRSLNLQREIAGMTEKPTSPGKRSKQDDRSPKKLKDQGKLRDSHTPPLLKPIKIKSLSKPAAEELPIDELPVEQVKTSTAKNDTPNKFWASVEPYCAPFTEDDLKFVEELISSNQDDEEYFKIPPLGRHYTFSWAEYDLHQEQKEGSRLGDKKKLANTNFGCDDSQRLLDTASKQNGESNAPPPTICGPITQRLISALMEENIVTSLQDTMECEGQDENIKSASAPVTLNGPQSVALERRIRQELEEQGILAADEANVAQADDEILTELRRCQAELKAISKHNLQQLNRLSELGQEEIKRQEVKKMLTAADAEVLDVYRKLSSNKLKKRPVTAKEKAQLQNLAWKALRDREAIVKQLDTG